MNEALFGPGGDAGRRRTPLEIWSERLYSDAGRLIANGDRERALRTLAPVVRELEQLPLSGPYLWMDFARVLDSFLFVDLFPDRLIGRKPRQHPLHPAKLLFAYGSLLVSLRRGPEAVEALTRLVRSLDPVYPLYIFELGEAYKLTGDFQSTYENALWVLNCAANYGELARCYRNLAYVLSEVGCFEDALSLTLLSLRYERSPFAADELNWIHRRSGLTPDRRSGEEIAECCARRGIRVGLSPMVLGNLALLNTFFNPPPSDTFPGNSSI